MGGGGGWTATRRGISLMYAVGEKVTGTVDRVAGEHTLDAKPKFEEEAQGGHKGEICPFSKGVRGCPLIHTTCTKYYTHVTITCVGKPGAAPQR